MTQNMVQPVRIAGAGLAGLTAALVLARAGRFVEVFERKARPLPSSGPHTEAIRNYRGVDARDELRSVQFDVEPFATVSRTIRRSPCFENQIEGPAHYLFLRGREENTVDQILYRRAKEAGVEFHFGKEVAPEDVDIAATGPPPGEFNILGAGYTFTAEGSSLDRETAYALFDNDIAPAGYLAITPGDRFHSIYSVSWKEFDFDRLMERTTAAFELPWVKSILGSSRWVGRIRGVAYYAKDPISTAVRGDTLYVGEAGGFQDAVAGFGFRYAAMTGGLAARAILEGQDYRDLLTSTFGREFLDSYAFRDQLNHATNADYDRMVAGLGERLSLNEYVRRREPRGF